MSPSDLHAAPDPAGTPGTPEALFPPDSPSPAVTAPLTDPATAPLNGTDVLAHLGDVVAQRRAEGDPDKSYVAKLFAKGLDQILKKVGEEATEVVIAGVTAARRVLGRLQLGVEGKLVGARVRLPVADGSMRGLHGSAHLVAFVGAGP